MKLLKNGLENFSFQIKIILLLIVISLLFGCAPVEEPPKTSGEVMKVAKYYWPGSYWVEIADKKGWFEEAGLNVQLIDTNLDYYQSLLDTAEGKIDSNDLYLFDIMGFINEGTDLVLVINSEISFGAEAIVARSEIENIADLKGKKIGVSEESALEYLLTILLEDNGMNMDDVKPINIIAENAEEEFIKRGLDAIVTWEPFVTEIIENHNARKLWDTSSIEGISPMGSVFHKSFIEKRPDDVQAFVNVWHKTTEFIKNNPKEAFGIIAENYGNSPGDVQAFTDEVKILDLEDNKISFSYASGFESLHGTARQINDFMIKKGLTDKKLDSLDFIDARFIRNVRQ
jgi:NitT/TauT family transport system substrate-binding protein